MRKIVAASTSACGLALLLLLSSCAMPPRGSGPVRMSPAAPHVALPQHQLGSLVNGDFSDVEAGVPRDWRVKDPGISLSARDGVAYLAPAGIRPNQRARLVQLVDAQPWRGKLVRLSARVRVLRAGDHVGLRINVDRPEGLRGFNDIMEEVPLIAGDWRKVSVVGVVESDATVIEVGASLSGLAEIEIDDIRFEEFNDYSKQLSLEARNYLGRALKIIRTQHINAPNGDWAAIEARAYRHGAGASVPRDTYPAIRGVLSAMGDNHSFLLPPRRSQAPAATAAVPPTRPLPSYSLMDGCFGYVSVPPLIMLGAADRSFGWTYLQRLREGVRTLDRTPLCGWIIDLRENSGGNMWPMLNGLTPLLGTPPFGSFVSPAGKKDRWVIDRGLVTVEGDDLRDLGLTSGGFRPRQFAAPVAILLGPNTASSGEAVAIAFAGRPSTRSFGRQSAGYTTANLTTDLSDGAILGVASSWEADRLGREYRHSITPDETVAEGDEMKVAALWLDDGCADRLPRRR